MTVRFRPGFVVSSVGIQNGILSIDSNDPTRPRVDVPLTGRGLGALVSSPASLGFGSANVCSPGTTAILTLTNTGNAPLTITSISTTNPAFAVTPRPTLPLSLAPAAGLNLTLTFAPRATGPQTGSLIIGSDAVNSAGLNIALSGTGVPLPPPTIGQLSVSRTTLSHGRADTVRPISPFNPFGLVDVIGFVFPGAPLPANSIAPGIIAPPLIGGFPGLPPAAIPSAPDPSRITLAGGVGNPIVVSAANIPSCFTLVVAEGVAAPDLTRWDRVGTRFGAGNLYASVAIPGTAIFAGMELVTEVDFEAYTANSIIYEAPAFGLVVAPAGQNGGTATIQARARKISTDTQCQPLLSQPQSVQVEFSRTVRIEILTDRTVITPVGGQLDVTVTAQISGNFDPAVNTVVRWAFDGEAFDEVVDAADMSQPGAPRLVIETFHVPLADECKLAQITVVASSTGNVPAAFLPPINPFLEVAPTSIGLFTFRSGGSTVEDTKALLIRAPDSNCGGGVPVGWIRGVVTNAATGERLAGARVNLTGTNDTAITGDDGTYELNNVPIGSQALAASADGFAPKQVPVTVTAGQVVTQDISLLPQTGSINGFVISLAGYQPVVGATIVVKGTAIGTVSGADGSYTLSSAPIGPQTVTASAPGFNAEQAEVNVIAGQTSTEDFFLTPVVGTLGGIVRNATTNQAIVGATVSTAGISTTTGGNGSYTLNNIPEGPQTLTATADGFNPASVSLTVIAGTTVTRDIAMNPLLGTLTGVVRNADTADPIPGATITVAGTALSATSGADGSYTMVNVPAGVQTLNASANGYVSGQATGANIVGNATVSRDFTLAPRTGKIQGRITNAKSTQAITNAEVELLPFPLTFANSDGNGNYTLNGVSTGQQVILASAPGFYAKLAVVNVTADQTSTQDFSLTPKVGIVTGIVFDNTSQPVPSATILVAGTAIATTTDVDGRYTLIDVQEGTQTLNVTAPGPRSAQVTVNVVGNETVYKDIYLQTPTGTVRGTVKNAVNNQPIVGASILVGIPFGAVYYSAFTDGNGNYALTDIPVGNLTIYVGGDGFDAQQATVVIVA
ncbi:MAG: carboxypeptidase regulatory-like domain-containing protein, partial [Acidobacteriota bacterium]